MGRKLRKSKVKRVPVKIECPKCGDVYTTFLPENEDATIICKDCKCLMRVTKRRDYNARA